MTVIADATADFLAYGLEGPLAVSINYTVQGGTLKAIQAVPNAEPEILRQWSDGQGLDRRLRLVISIDATEGIASPTPGDIFAYDGDTFVVKDVERMPEVELARLMAETTQQTEVRRQEARVGRMT